jgi:hypothetical protein
MLSEFNRNCLQIVGRFDDMKTQRTGDAARGMDEEEKEKRDEGGNLNRRKSILLCGAGYCSIDDLIA